LSSSKEEVKKAKQGHRPILVDIFSLSKTRKCPMKILPNGHKIREQLYERRLKELKKAS
jgi:hypothetical protein